MPVNTLGRLGKIATLTPLLAGLLFSLIAVQDLAPAMAQPSSEVSSSPIRSILRRIFRDDDESQPPAISRGDIACLIAPARPGSNTVIWHDRPVLVWEGTPGKIDVFDPATDLVLWEYTPTDGETHVRYGGERLQAGGRYQWRVYDPQDLVFPQSFPTFEILPPINRLLIAHGLRLATNKTNGSAEAVAIAQADYFAAREMEADAIQALFAVASHSLATTGELEDAQAEIIATVCE